MKAVRYAKHGVPTEVVEVIELETGAAEADEVVIRVEASPINPSDLLTLSGEYGSLPPLPAIPGNEGIGSITAVGEGVQDLAPGQRVFLPVGAGTWREEMRVAATGLVPAPAGDPLQLAMLMINPPTAYLMLHDMVALEAGEWVIQNAANSGVGGYVIELARQAGLRTVNLVRREALVAPLTAKGADAVVVSGPDLATRVAEATGGAKIRLGLDAIGGNDTMALADCLATGGVVVNYGLLSGKACKLSSTHTIFKDIGLRGFWLARWFRRSARGEQAALYAKLAAMLAKGELSCEIEATYPIAEAEAALAHAMRPGRGGKILFAPAGG